jgi:hypothetical protein
VYTIRAASSGIIAALERDLPPGLTGAASASPMFSALFESKDEARTGAFRKELLRSDAILVEGSRPKDDILAVTLSKKLPFERGLAEEW